jgi:hypothetical protein
LRERGRTLERRVHMADVAFVLLTLAFFVLSLGYIVACERLGEGR